MAKLLSDVRSETRTYLDESSAVDFTDAEVDRSINRSFHDVVGAVMDVFEEHYSTTTPYTYAIVANQQEYTVASSLIRPTRVEINYTPTTSGSIAVRAFPIKKDEVRINLNSTSYLLSKPGYYLHGSIGAQKIGFVPVPTVADTTGQSISVWGIDIPSDLSAAGDNVNIPYADRFVYLIALKAAAQLLRKGQQEETAAQNYLSEYRSGIIEMQNFLKDRISDDFNRIIDVQSENVDFSEPL